MIRPSVLPCLYTLLLLPCLAAPALSRPARNETLPLGSPSAYVLNGSHNVGLLTLRVTNVGFFGGGLAPGKNARWRGAEYLWLSGLWIGAIGGDDELHVTTASPIEMRADLDPRWVLYESFEGQKNGVRIGPGGAAFADDDGDGLIDEDFQNGFDDDGDGLVDEDFAAIGQQNLSAMYRDDTPEAMTVPGHYPLHLLVRQSSYQWSTSGINEMVGVTYDIINTGDQRLRDVYIGLYTDADIGMPDEPDYWTDDLVGWAPFDTTVVVPGELGLCAHADYSIPYVFMQDVPTGVPGVIGTALLGHTTDRSGLRAPPQVDVSAVDWWESSEVPNTDALRYQTLASQSKPAQDANTPRDYQFLMSVGPFTQFHPGESLRFQIAYVIGQDTATFRKNVVAAKRVFNGRYIDADQNPLTGVDGMETCLQVMGPGQVIVWDDPCDTLYTPITFRSTPPCDEPGPHHVDADCNSCTGIQGRETPVHWIGQLAPPNPGTNLDPTLDPLLDPDLSAYLPPVGDGVVRLQWNNRPELWTDPATGLDIFEGYRVWKVSDWTGVDDPPGPEVYEPIREYRLHPLGGGGSADSLQSITNNVQSIGMTEDGKPIYPIGRYEVEDADVVNGGTYFYAVTAFGTVVAVNPATSLPETTEVGGLPYSPLSFAVTVCDTCDSPTPVRLESFTLEREGESAVLRWTVAEATDHAGFHVYREEPGQERIRLTETLLTGQDLEFRDAQAPAGTADYWLEELSRTGAGTWYGPLTLQARPDVPVAITLGMATPNPFRDRMTLAYELPQARLVRAFVYDVSGRRVRTLSDRVQGPGSFSITWQGDTDAGTRVSGGAYLIRFEVDSEAYSRKVLLVR